MKKQYKAPLCEVENVSFTGALLGVSGWPIDPGVSPAPRRRGDVIE
jgi:hypothetical protein